MKKVLVLIMVILVFASISFNPIESNAVTPTHYKTTFNTVIYSNAKFNGGIVREIKKNTKLQSNYKVGKWVKVHYKNSDGWIHSKFLKKYTPPKGYVEGVVTWQYNQYVGTKPDVGANVVALPIGGFKKITDANFNYGIESNGLATKYGFYLSKVNGFGNYKLRLPEGSYYIVIVSSDTYRNYHKNLSTGTITTMTKYIKKYTKDDLILDMKNHKIKKVTIKKNDPINIDIDWGYSYM